MFTDDQRNAQLNKLTTLYASLPEDDPNFHLRLDLIDSLMELTNIEPSQPRRIDTVGILLLMSVDRHQFNGSNARVYR